MCIVCIMSFHGFKIEFLCVLLMIVVQKKYKSSQTHK